MLVASARSIDGCNITELLASQAENLITFGGHSAAAGHGNNFHQSYMMGK